MRISTVCKWTLGLSALTVILLWFGITVPGMYFRGAEMIAAVAGILIPFSLMALCCAATLEAGRVRALMFSGIVAAALAAAGWMVTAWLDMSGTWWQAVEFAAGLSGTLATWSGFCMVLALVMRYRASNVPARIARVGTIIIGAVLTVAIFASIWAFDALWRDEDAAMRFFVGLSTLCGTGVLLSIVLARLRHFTGDRDELEESAPRIDFTLWCPRCESRQAFQTGGGSCRSCGLGIKVTPP